MLTPDSGIEQGLGDLRTVKKKKKFFLNIK
jgi:hypothetical protein